MNDRVLLLSVVGDPAYGAERILATLVHALPEDFSEHCLLLRPPGSSLARWAGRARVQHVDWTSPRDAAIYNLSTCFRAARKLRGQRIGLVHAWGARAFESAFLLGKLLGAGVCGTLHDHPQASFLSPLRRGMVRQLAPRLRPLVCVSHALAEACRDAGLEMESIVVHNGLPMDLPRAPADSRSGGPIRVGFLGL